MGTSSKSRDVYPKRSGETHRGRYINHGPRRTPLSRKTPLCGLLCYTHFERLRKQSYFSRNTIIPQTVRSYQPAFSAAFVAHVELNYTNDKEKNKLWSSSPTRSRYRLARGLLLPCVINLLGAAINPCASG